MTNESLHQYKEIRGCKIKKFFTNRSDARKAAKKMNNLTEKGRIRAYKCLYCHGYHIGHISPSRRDRQEQEAAERVLLFS